MGLGLSIYEDSELVLELIFVLSFHSECFEFFLLHLGPSTSSFFGLCWSNALEDSKPY